MMMMMMMMMKMMMMIKRKFGNVTQNTWRFNRYMASTRILLREDHGIYHDFSFHQPLYFISVCVLSDVKQKEGVL
jgi:hypothetical protein